MNNMLDGILMADNNPQVIIPVPEDPNKVVLANIKDIPNALYSLEVEITLKPKKNSLPVRKTYSNVVKVSTINKNLLEILKAPNDVYPSLIYLHLYDIEDFNIKFVGDTDADDNIIDKKLWNINYKEDKQNDEPCS